MGGGRWSGLMVEELTEVKWVLRELAMDDGLFESKADLFSGGPGEAVASSTTVHSYQKQSTINHKLEQATLGQG